MKFNDAKLKPLLIAAKQGDVIELPTLFPHLSAEPVRILVAEITEVGASVRIVARMTWYGTLLMQKAFIYPAPAKENA